MTRPTKIRILSIEFILAPTFTYLVVARLGVGPGAFIISGIAWALLLFSIRLFDSFTEDESPEESKAIDEEVERMEGRRMRINNNFDVCLPEGFKCVTVDDSNVRIINLETKRDTVISISLKDGKRITEIVNQTIKTL